jgi:glucosamine--fructose-6-phosphate aminotransferase (isomerizing)
MSNLDSSMAAEWRESPNIVARQSPALAPRIAELTACLRTSSPRIVVTCARGSSGHAANFGKYLIERYLGLPVSAISPSITSVYKRSLRLDGQLFLAISQSGRSDDLVEAAASARAGGAVTVAIVNEPESPLAATCDFVLPMFAGQEQSIPATKSFVASLAALLDLVAVWADVPMLKAARDRLPGQLEEASDIDWSSALEVIQNAQSLVTLGRGPTFAIALEASLKLKEICHIHAEAFSGAEFQHGPIALVSSGYPVLVFMPSDSSAKSLTSLAADLSRKKAIILATGNDFQLPVVASACAETDAICLIQTFYGLAVRLAACRGIDVDRPRHLKKITRTR